MDDLRPLSRWLLLATAVTLMTACTLKTPTFRKAASDQFVAQGNEPFWSLVTEDGVLIWKTPDNPAGTRLAVTRHSHAHGIHYTSTDPARPFRLEISDQPCTDSMSGATFELTATWAVDGTSHPGCARRRQ